MNISMETTETPIYGCNTTSLNEYKLLPYDAGIYAMEFIFGLPIHSYIVWLIVTGTGRGIASEFFTLNVSVCELVSCLRSLGIALLNTYPKLFRSTVFLSGVVITGRFFQCLICVERYMAVVHPVIFLKLKPLRYRAACCIVTWLLIAGFCVFAVLSQPIYGNNFMYVYLLQFSLFLAIDLFCCLVVLRALKQSGPGDRGKEKQEENHMKRRAFYLILITTVTLMITYVPCLFVAVQYILPTKATRELESMSLTFFVLSSYVQAVLYLHRVGKMPFCRSQ